MTGYTENLLLAAHPESPGMKNFPDEQKIGSPGK